MVKKKFISDTTAWWFRKYFFFIASFQQYPMSLSTQFRCFSRFYCFLLNLSSFPLSITSTRINGKRITFGCECFSGWHHSPLWFPKEDTDIQIKDYCILSSFGFELYHDLVFLGSTFLCTKQGIVYITIK